MKLKILGQEFSVPPAYSPGHQLTPAEAQALEGLRLDRIREQLSKSQRNGAPRLTQPEVEAFARAWNFEFRPETAWRRDEVDREARGLAELRAAGSGLTPGDLEWEQQVARLAADSELREQARARVEARRELLREQMDGLVA